MKSSRAQLNSALRRRYTCWHLVPTPRKPSRILRKVAFSTILTLLLGEASLRICHWANPSFIFYSCSYNRFRGRPFSDKYGYRLNSKGFNDTECEARKPAGTLRVLGIGDSFAFGVVPYANNYLTLLEEELRARGKKVEIVNMGIPCIGPEEYLSVLASEGLDLDPDMVLVSFFVGNDFETPQPRPAWSYSYLYSFADFGRKYLGQMIHGDGQYQDDRPSMTDDTYLQIECVRSLVFKVKDQGFARAFPGAVHPLLDMKRICYRRGICF